MGSYFYRSQPRKKPEYPEKTLCRWWTIVALTTLPPPKPPMQTSFLNWRLNISDQPTQTRIVYWILVTLEKHKRLLLSTIYTAHPPPPPPQISISIVHLNLLFLRTGTLSNHRHLRSMWFFKFLVNWNSNWWIGSVGSRQKIWFSYLSNACFACWNIGLLYDCLCCR